MRSTNLSSAKLAQLPERPWDPDNRYTEGFIKAFNCWCLEISYRQHTLGCYIVFARRQVERISELSSEELTELAFVNSEIETALTSNPIFRPDQFNYLQLGNQLHHLHLHGIPRYVSPREAFLKAADFEILHHYYRPADKPRHEQPWLAIVSRSVNRETNESQPSEPAGSGHRG